MHHKITTIAPRYTFSFLFVYFLVLYVCENCITTVINKSIESKRREGTFKFKSPRGQGPPFVPKAFWVQCYLFTLLSLMLLHPLNVMFTSRAGLYWFYRDWLTEARLGVGRKFPCPCGNFTAKVRGKFPSEGVPPRGWWEISLHRLWGNLPSKGVGGKFPPKGLEGNFLPRFHYKGQREISLQGG